LYEVNNKWELNFFTARIQDADISLLEAYWVEAISRCMSVKTATFAIAINVAGSAALTVHQRAEEKLGR